MIKSFGSFAIENNFKELEKSLKLNGYGLEDKDLEDKFEELNKLITARENLTEAYEVGLLNVKYLSGESVNNSEYTKAILKIEKGDHDKLVKHYNYNLTKLFKAKNDLAGIIDDIKIPTASMESYNSSLQGYYVSVEGIGDTFSKIGEKIKKAWEYIINKMKKFFNWITGKSSEVDADVNAAKNGNIPQELGNVTGASIDMKGVTKKEDGTLEMSPEKYSQMVTQAFNNSINYLSKLQTDEVTPKDLTGILKNFEVFKVTEDMSKKINSKCISTKDVSVIDPKTKKTTTQKQNYVSKTLLINYLQKLQAAELDTRSRYQKLKDGASNAIKAVGDVAEKGVDLAKGFFYKCRKFFGVGDNVEQGKEATVVDGDANDTGNVHSCEDYIKKHLGTEFFTMSMMIDNPNISNNDIKNIIGTLEELSVIINSYYNGFKEGVDKAIKEKKSQMNNVANGGPTQASTNPNQNNNNNNNNVQDAIKKNQEAKKDLGVKVVIPEDVKKKMQTIVNEILDPKKTITDDFNKRLQTSEIVVESKGNQNVLDGKVIKCYGKKLNIVIALGQPADKTNMDVTKIDASEVEFKLSEQVYNNKVKEILNKPLSKIKTETDSMANIISGLKSISKESEAKFKKNTELLNKMLKYSDTTDIKKQGLTIDKESSNAMNRFIMNVLKLNAYLATAASNRILELSNQLTAYMNYSNELGKRINDAEALNNASGLNEAKSLLDSINNTNP